MGKLTIVALLILAAGAVPLPLSGQTSSTGSEVRLRWDAASLRAGWCVQFLVRPETIAKKFPRGYRAAPAAEVQPSHPALRRFVADEPVYAGWAPATLCTFYFDTIAVDGRPVTDKDLKDPQAIAWWTVAALPEEAGGPGEPDQALLMLATNNWRLQKPAEAVLVPLEKVDIRIQRPVEATDNQYQLRMGKTLVLFDGHPIGDAAGAGAERLEQTWVVGGSLNHLWRIRSSFRPGATRLVSGSLRVQGKNDLAEALQASPVRILGPWAEGGNGELTFSR